MKDDGREPALSRRLHPAQLAPYLAQCPSAADRELDELVARDASCSSHRLLRHQRHQTYSDLNRARARTAKRPSTSTRTHPSNPGAGPATCACPVEGGMLDKQAAEQSER